MTEEAPAGQPAGEESVEPRPRPRRRRRGGRGRGRGRSTTSSTDTTSTDQSSTQGPTEETPPQAEAAASSDEKAEADQTPSEGGSRSGRSRSRSRSRSKPSGSKTEPKGSSEDESADEPADGGDKPATASRSRSAARRRRRRRSSTGAAAKPKEADASADGKAEPQPAEEATASGAQDGASEGKPSSSARRRRRRRRRPGEGPGEGDGKATVTAAAAPATRSKAAPSTRAARPTRTSRAARRGSPFRRRQPQVQVTRRTEKTMLMTEREGRVEVVVLEERQLVEHYVTRTGAQSMVGNVYLGRVQSVLPGMEAAFVDIGRGRNAVLYAGEVSYDEDVDAGDRRIERALKQGQSVVVQVTKDPLKGKGARLTAQVSLPGRYLVYVPDGGASGISRRLPDAERERLRGIMKKIRPSEAGVIVRTAAEGASEEELAADLDRLKKAWESLRRKGRRGRAPKVLYEEPELLERVVRDIFSPAEFEKIVTDSPEIYDRVRTYLGEMAPTEVDRVQLHDGSLPLFETFHVTEQIHKALERKVWLPSGGYLVIDRVEAMTVIDVNTGKHVGKTNLEETVVGTNVEAAKEIPRQLRLRDIGGIIIIDFIDMTLQSNRDQVVRTLREELAHDKTRSQVFDITHLGLLEVTRKKVSAGLLEAYSETCPTCEGRGILLTHEI